jgi:mannose-6-phosphate isomerase-like protein (cupin superfamily)
MLPEKNFTASPAPRHATIAGARALLPVPGPGVLRSVAALQHGTLLLKFYSPVGDDPQKPHTRDELYIVASGTGVFLNGDTRHAFGPGDAIFVPAGVTHRFESFTADFQVWVVFYGAEGGEAVADSGAVSGSGA